MRRARKPAERCIVLRTAEALGPMGRAADSLAIELLDHEHAVLREAAAAALARTASPAAVEPLVRRIAREPGRTRVRMGMALEILTRRQMGASPSAWRRWFEEEGEPYASGEVELGGGEPSARAAPIEEVLVTGEA